MCRLEQRSHKTFLKTLRCFPLANMTWGGVLMFQTFGPTGVRGQGSVVGLLGGDRGPHPHCWGPGCWMCTDCGPRDDFISSALPSLLQLYWELIHKLEHTRTHTLICTHTHTHTLHLHTHTHTQKHTHTCTPI